MGVKIAKLAIVTMIFSLMLAVIPTNITLLGIIAAYGFIGGFFALFIGVIIGILRDEKFINWGEE